MNPHTLFNAFLSRAAQHGRLDVEHFRLLARQPDTEVFTRKALVSLRELAPELVVACECTELSSGESPHGWQALASASEAYLQATSSLAFYLGEPEHGHFFALPDWEPGVLFGLLHSYAYAELCRRVRGVPEYGLAVASGAMGLSGHAGAFSQPVRDAADSVYAQSFCDVHALSLVAAFNGRQAALDMLSAVTARRRSGGDYGEFSLAPLSQDTSAALELLRGRLREWTDMSILRRSELFAYSTWAASEGLGDWLQKHGVSHRDSTSVGTAAELSLHIVASAFG